MALFNTLFRHERTTSTQSRHSQEKAANPSLPATTPPHKPLPPSSYKFTPSPSAKSSKESLTAGRPNGSSGDVTTKASNAEIKVRDFALERDDSLFSPSSRPLPPTLVGPSVSRRHQDRPTPGSRITTPRSTPKQPGGSPSTRSPVPLYHHRTTSGPLPSKTPPTVRQRSSTLQAVTPGPHTRGSPLAHSSSSPRYSNESNRRPQALRLRTTNLTPPPSPTRSSGIAAHGTHNKRSLNKPPPYSLDPIEVIQDGEPSLSIYTNVPLIQRSESAENVFKSDPSDRCGLTPSSQHGESQKQPPGIGPDHTERQTPTSRGSERITSPSSSQANPVPEANQTRPFDSVPLPWSSTSADQLCAELGQAAFTDLVQYTLRHLAASQPRLLRPSVLKTSAAEDARLRAELSRLKTKHASLVTHRDSLFSQLESGEIRLESGALRRTIESVRKATKRCDRIARQICICNDQIRQIEIQGEEHVVGTLRVALAQLERSKDPSCDVQTPTSFMTDDSGDGSDGETITAQLVEIQSIKPSGKVKLEHDISEDPYRSSQNLSSAALFTSFNKLGFPLPPAREVSEANNKPDRPRLSTGQSASTSQLDVFVEEEDHEILIYPPSHRRSASAPVIQVGRIQDLPHTPWRNQHQAIIPGTTAPLRIKEWGKKPQTKAHSMKARKRKSTDSTRRAKRGRESQLETPASILLSLATPELWTTKHADHASRNDH